MTLSIPILAWCSAFAAYAAAACLSLRAARRHRRALRELADLNSYARALLRVQAWGVVYLDRRDRGSPLSHQALLGLQAALDCAESEKARLVADGVLP